MTHPHRIIWLIDSLGLGGAERLLVTYLQHLTLTSFDLRVCALQIRNGNPIAAEIRRLGVPVDFIPLRHLRDVAGLPRLVRYLRQQQADLLHTQLEFADTMGSIAAKIRGVPAVATLHTLHNPPKGTRSYWRDRLKWWSLRHCCDRVIAVSEGARQHYIRLGRLTPEKVTTLYNGIDLSCFTPQGQAERAAKRQDFEIPADAPLIITVAVLRSLKGIQYLIEAMPAILQTVPTARYLVVGSGPHEAELKRLAQTYGVAERVIFSGARQDIPDLLAMSDLFVLPTLTEALPTVLAEAMAARKPIVASKVGGVPEMIEHGANGFLIPPADPARLAEACIQLLQNPSQAQAMADTGWQIVQRRFNIQQQAHVLGHLYQELLIKGEG